MNRKIVCGHLPPGIPEPIRRYGDHHEIGEFAGQLFGRQGLLRQATVAIGVNQDRACRQEDAQLFDVGDRVYIDHHALLAGVQGGKPIVRTGFALAVVARPVRTQRVASGRFDLDDGGAHFAEQLAGIADGGTGAELDNLEVGVCGLHR